MKTRARLAVPGLLVIAALAGCPRNHAKSDAPVTLIVDGADLSLVGAAYEIAVDDSSGALVRGPLTLTAQSIAVAVPAGGSLTLRESRGSLAHLKTWVAPPPGTTIHAVDSIAPAPTPSPTVTNPTVFFVRLTPPPAGTASYRVLAYCDDVVSLNSSGIIVTDAGCPDEPVTPILGLSYDSSGQPTAWGATTMVSGQPGGQSVFGQNLDFTATPRTISFTGLPSVTIRESLASSIRVNALPPVGGAVTRVAIGVSADSISVNAFDDSNFPAPIAWSIASTSEGLSWSGSLDPAVDSAIDLTGDPSFGARTFDPVQRRWTFAITAPFGSGVFLIAGSSFVAWLPADAPSFSLPALPAGWSAPLDTVTPAQCALVSTDAANGFYPLFLGADFFSPGAPPFPDNYRMARAEFLP